MELKHIKAYIADEKDSIDEINHSILFTIPETVDRDDEIVTAEAIFNAINDEKTFAANPICLPCHQHRLEGGQPPCVGGWDVESARQLTNAVNIRLNFAFQTKLGAEYWNCYSKKHMRAISIGFSSLEWRMEDRSGNQVRIITKIELYEISCVAVGANPGALSKLKEQFGWDENEISAEIKTLIANAAKKATDSLEQRISALEAEIEDLKILLIPDSDELAEFFLGKDDESFVPAENIAETLAKKINETA